MTPRESIMTPLPEIERTTPPLAETQRMFTIEARVFSLTCSPESRGVLGAEATVCVVVAVFTGTGFLATTFLVVEAVVDETGYTLVVVASPTGAEVVAGAGEGSAAN